MTKPIERESAEAFAFRLAACSSYTLMVPLIAERDRERTEAAYAQGKAGERAVRDAEITAAVERVRAADPGSCCHDESEWIDACDAILRELGLSWTKPIERESAEAFVARIDADCANPRHDISKVFYMYCGDCLTAAIAERDRERDEDLVRLHGAIDELSIGAGARLVDIYIYKPGDVKPTVIHPEKVHQLFELLRAHAVQMGDFGRRALEGYYELDKVKRRFANRDAEIRAAVERVREANLSASPKDTEQAAAIGGALAVCDAILRELGLS